jgi:toxin ParE1/3/4
MTLPLSFHPAVGDEVDDGYRWYEARQAGLGRDFLDEVQDVLAAITANPSRFGFANNNIREGLLPRFPYAIYYRLLRDRVRVLSVFHTARDPSVWQSRT